MKQHDTHASSASPAIELRLVAAAWCKLKASRNIWEMWLKRREKRAGRPTSAFRDRGHTFSSYAVIVKKELNNSGGIEIASTSRGGESMADEQLEDATIVPLPTGETEEEHEAVRSSNDLDQRLEREGIVSRHNRGYDEAAKGTRGTNQNSEGKV